MSTNSAKASSLSTVEDEAKQAYRKFVEDSGNLDLVLKNRGLPTRNMSSCGNMRYGVTTTEVAAYNTTMAEKLKSIFQSIHNIKNHQAEKSSETMNAIESLKKRLTSGNLKVEEKEQCEQHMWALIAKARTESSTEMSYMKDALYRLAEMKILSSEKLLSNEEDGLNDGSIIDDNDSSAVPRFTNYGGVLKQALEQYAAAIPVFLGQPLERAPELCGCIPPGRKYIAQIMDKVAALISMQQPASCSQSESSSGADSPLESDEQWILAEIVSYDSHNKAYHVKDVYPEEKIKRRYVVERKRVIPLPKTIANPDFNKEALFAMDSRVLALYPQTTCFYPGYVRAIPEQYSDSYTIVFDDKTYRSGFAPPMAIPPAFVLRHPP